ncbi:MAG: cobalamin biosynthesis protein CobD [Acidobacteriota bacterium]|nr:cobalamin biosynthesis protein CobD [Acidobacteriota bacterium]
MKRLGIGIRPLWLVGAACGVFIDRLVGEPPTSAHPLVYFGRAMGTVEGMIYRDSRRRGILHALIGTSLGGAAGRFIRSTALSSYVAVGGRALGEAANSVGDALAREDLDRARELLPALVGRDPRALDETEISRAVVESVAENTVDAVVAPMMWAALCGPVGALAYRSINTLDAMVGHHSERYEKYGWASARLDDVVNFVPARVTALLVALVRPRATFDVVRGVATQAPGHPSPNSGVGEVAFAAALGLRLGGRNIYDGRVEDRVHLGYGRAAKGADIKEATRLARDVATLLAVLLIVAGVVFREPRRIS